jgi:hypothetical protein
MDINRAVVVVKPRQPYVDWANSFDDGIVTATLESLRRDSSVYLVPPYDMDDEREDILKVCFSVIFENELEGWVTDETLWPKRRDYATFRQWFDVEFHSMIIDLWDEPLEHEDV